MGTPKDKPIGSMDYVLAIDGETTGLKFGADDPSDGHQAISWGIIVADATTLKPVEELYVEIKWNEASKQARKTDSTFGQRAEEIHGLTFNYLEENGIFEKDAAVAIASLIMKYWGPTVSVKTLGHNVHTFDMPFLRAMFRRAGIDVTFGGRHYDTNSISFGTVGAFNSDDFFTTMGMEQRDTHNALTDAHMALESARRVKIMWRDLVGLNAYE